MFLHSERSRLGLSNEMTFKRISLYRIEKSGLTFGKKLRKIKKKKSGKISHFSLSQQKKFFKKCGKLLILTKFKYLFFLVTFFHFCSYIWKRNFWPFQWNYFYPNRFVQIPEIRPTVLFVIIFGKNERGYPMVLPFFQSLQNKESNIFLFEWSFSFLFLCSERSRLGLSNEMTFKRIGLYRIEKSGLTFGKNLKKIKKKKKVKISSQKKLI